MEQLVDKEEMFLEFMCLTPANRDCVIAFTRALMFAQNVESEQDTNNVNTPCEVVRLG